MGGPLVSDAQMLAAVVIGGILPMVGFWVVEYRRNQARHEACEAKLEARAEAYHSLTERVALAIEQRSALEARIRALEAHIATLQAKP